MPRVVLAWTIVSAMAIALLARGLPPEGFFAGDPGLKLKAAFAAIDHPGRPFQLDLPIVGGKRQPWVDPMIQVHGDHAHALQSPLFPVLAAPFIAFAGPRGAYWLPALAFVLLVPLLNAIRRALVPSVSPALLGLFAVALNPVFFYALEFWEHVPAITLLAAATAALVGRSDQRPKVTHTIGAGVLSAVAVLLRPEAAWYVAGLLIALRPPMVTWCRVAVGCASVILPFAIANVLHSGHPMGPHATANLAPLGDAYLASRVHRATLWLAPTSAMGLSGVVLVALGWGARLLPGKQDISWLALAGASLIAVSGALGQLPRDSLWTAWPAGALVLAALRVERGATVLLATSGITFAGILLTSTHDGGAQWGPRFLLIASPALIVFAAHAAQSIIAARDGRRWFAMAAVAAVCVSGLAMTRLAYRELRASKRYYARAVSAAKRIVPPGGYAVTDVWWFDQIAASLARDRTILYVPDLATANEAIGALSAAGERTVTLVGTNERPGVLSQAVSGSCFREVRAERIPERQLTFSTLQCDLPRE